MLIKFKRMRTIILSKKILNEIKESIKESPDYTVDSTDQEHWWDDGNAFPFTIPNTLDKIYIGGHGESHNKLMLDSGVMDFDAAIEREKNNYIQGRVWLDGYISFWVLPSPTQLNKIIHLLNSYELFSDLFDFYEFELEVDDYKYMPVVDYIKGGEQKQTNFDLSTMHTLPADKKRETTQMQNVLNAKYNKIGKQLGKQQTDGSEETPNGNNRSVPQAEYSFYKRYGMGDSVKCKPTISENLNTEINASDINLKSFKPKDELNPKFWVNNKLNSNVRLKLLDIADDFIDTLGMKNIKITDIVFTGSLANYNWSKYSDIDLHIILDYKSIYNDVEILSDYFNTKKNEWNEEHENLKIYGFPVEVYVEDSNGESSSSGIYSLEKNKWVIEPEPIETIKLNKFQIKDMAAKIMTKIDGFENIINSEKDNHKIDVISIKIKKLFDSLKYYRKIGLEREGEMSANNIVYKILRRSGHLQKLYDLKSKTYDIINSLK